MQNYRKMRLVDVDRTSKLRLFAHRLTEDHDLLEEEDRKRFHLGHLVAATSTACGPSLR